MMISYTDDFVKRLACDVEALIDDPGSVSADAVLARLLELAEHNCLAFGAYSRRFGLGVGLPDCAFRDAAQYHFPDVEPALTFETSGTTGALRGRAHYSPLGERLLRATILAGARRHILTDLERPAIVRLVPARAHAPRMVMAYGMELIEEYYGDPAGSGSVVGSMGIDHGVLEQRLERAVAADQPVVLIGASFAFVNLCESLRARGKRWRLPRGSRMVDAGGYKGRSRTLGVAELRALMLETFDLSAARATNIFGMTELASQLYDSEDRALGPQGERPKGAQPHVWPRLRDPHDLGLMPLGMGLLEVVDLCILDRPCVVLTGDLGVGDETGVAVAGRIQRGSSRGCSLTLDAWTAQGGSHARA